MEILVLGAMFLLFAATVIGVAIGFPTAGYIFLSWALLIWGIRKLVTRSYRWDVLWGLLLIGLSIVIYANSANLPQWRV